MAQWIARQTSDLKVGGSSPPGVYVFCPFIQICLGYEGIFFSFFAFRTQSGVNLHQNLETYELIDFKFNLV